jgi:hypothetical protein
MAGTTARRCEKKEEVKGDTVGAGAFWGVGWRDWFGVMTRNRFLGKNRTKGSI